MDFCLEREERLADGVRRLAGLQFGKAISHLESTSAPWEEHVHEARKSLKRLRALLHLVRFEVGEETFRRENAALGQAGHLLAGLRDAAVLGETLEKLDKEGRFPQVRAWLKAQRDARYQPQNRGTVSQALEALRWAQVRLELWPLQGQNWSAIGPGVRWVYARGRRAMRRAYRQRQDEDFHGWRKYAKYLWYHSQLLQGIWPAVMEATAGALDRLGEALGQDHDLAVLRSTCLSELADSPELAALEERICPRRALLQAEAQRLGQRLYAESPDAFEQRWSRYWAAWQEEVDTALL